MFTRFIISLFIVACTFVPLWIFLGARMLFAPQGFWQNLVLTGLGVWILGGIQIIFLVCGALLLLAFLAETQTGK